MRSDVGLKNLLDLMLADAYSSGGAGYATIPQRDSYVEDRMEVKNDFVYHAYKLLEQDGWHLVEAHNKRLWVPEGVNQHKCAHH